jgi:hypothetical protein
MLSESAMQWLVIGSAGTAVIAIVLAIVAMASASRLKKRLQAVLHGGSIDLEDSIIKIRETAQDASQSTQNFNNRITTLEAKTAQTLNKFGLVRFNPFDDTGADLSFSLALLNDVGDGVVLTSLWGRNEIRLYAKPVKAQESRYPLSQEEKRAIELAITTRLGSVAEGPRTKSARPS